MLYRCVDCAKLNLNDQNSYGEYWCCEWCRYYPSDDWACSRFVSYNEERMVGMSYCCADCAKLNLNDQNSYGEYWCGERRTYYPGSDSICSYFVNRNGDGCFITTIVVECLGYDDYCKYLETLRGFRDDVMKKDPVQYGLILDEYDKVGPVIAAAISNDPQRVNLAKELLEKYIKPVCLFVDKGKQKAAVDLYKEMVIELQGRYKM